MILKNGNCKYLAEVMSAYKRHDGGISHTYPSIQVKRWIDKLNLLDKLDIYTELKFSREIKEHKLKLRMNVSWYLLKYPTLINNIGVNLYLEFILSKHLVKVLINKIKLKVM